MDTPPVTVRHRPSPSVSSVSARQLRQLRQARRRPSAPSHSVTSVTPVYASETQLDGRFPGINLTSPLLQVVEAFGWFRFKRNGCFFLLQRYPPQPHTSGLLFAWRRRKRRPATRPPAQ